MLTHKAKYGYSYLLWTVFVMSGRRMMTSENLGRCKVLKYITLFDNYLACVTAFLFDYIILIITQIVNKIIPEQGNILNSKFCILLITAKPVNPMPINCDVLFSKIANKERSFLSLFFPVY